MEEGDKFDEEKFNKTFADLDKNNSGKIEKSEMVVFIKQILCAPVATAAMTMAGVWYCCHFI